MKLRKYTHSQTLQYTMQQHQQYFICNLFQNDLETEGKVNEKQANVKPAEP